MSQPHILRTEVRDATAWKGPDLRDDSSWVHRLSAAEIEEIDAAYRGVSAAGLAWGEFQQAQFPLPSLSGKLQAIDHEIRNGRGFVLVKGLPVERYSIDQLKTIYWGLGVHMGQVISHNVAGDFVAAVTDQGLKSDDPNRRNNTTAQMLDPHTDLADVVALLCVERAKEGGLSTLVSSTAIHNEILRQHPEYLEVLYEGFFHDYRGYGPSADPNEVTATPIPVFEFNKGRINCAFAKKIIETGAKKRGVPLTPLQQAAIDFVHELGTREDLRLDMMLEPGDIQIINNYITLHSRSNYIDHDDGRKRYLLRMWINLRDSVQLSPGFAEFVRRGIPAQQVSA
jgi:alpha-ketoglutarate-dependent taurine dioxygenase